MARVRTVISLDPEDKAWLDKEARRRGVSMTQLIRVALRTMRQTTPPHEPSFDKLLSTTRGLWSKGDGLTYQQRIRDEW